MSEALRKEFGFVIKKGNTIENYTSCSIIDYENSFSQVASDSEIKLWDALLAEREKVARLTEENERNGKAVAFIRNGVERLDCQDNSCYFAKDKSGMRTNGGCRCLPNSKIEHGIRMLLQKDATKPTVCRWKQDEDGIWTTSCDLTWGMENGEGIVKNHMNYCPKCSLPIVEVKDGKA